MAPAPAIMLLAFIARRTIMIESLRERSASSMNWVAPPLRIMVADWV